MNTRIHVKRVSALPRPGQLMWFDGTLMASEHVLTIWVLKSRVRAEDVPRLERALQAEMDQVVDELVEAAA